MMPGIKKNFLYSSILTTANYIFPFILFPYVSRVLGVANNGKCSFIDSLVNYFILFSMMGVSIMGIREIAAHRGDKRQLAFSFSNLLMLNLIVTFIAIVLLLCATFFVPYLSSYRDLLYIGVLKLLFNVFLIEWLYKGLEEFRYITVRSIAVRFLYLLLVLVFVRSSKDYVIYFFLTTMIVVVNAIINCWHSRRFVQFSFSGLHMQSYVRPFFMLGVYLLLTSMYTSFNVTFLGFVSGDVQVGLYSTAVKLFNIIVALFSAFTGVMLPRMSSLVESGRMEDFKTLLYKSVDVLFCISVPLVIFTIIMARPIVYLISGKEYEGAVVLLQIVAALILIIGYEQILVMQALMPLKEDKVILRNSFMGALLGVFLNVILVPKWQGIGSSVCWLLSETLILILSQRFMSKAFEVHFPFRRFFTVLIGYAALIPMLYGIYCFFQGNVLWQLFVGGVIMCIYAVCVQLFFLKNSVVLSLMSKFHFKIRS
ncbi:MAG: flippase [Paraprevotella sp.]|nr:flippase [Paraprevotella sp.]